MKSSKGYLSIYGSTRSTGQRAGGFTLIESLIAIAILGVASSALLVPFSLAAKHQNLDAVSTTAIALANQMTERLTGMTYNEVLALNGVSESGLELTDSQGKELKEDSLAGYGRTVTAVEIPLPVGAQQVADAAIFCRAVVTVSHTGMKDVVITRLFAK